MPGILRKILNSAIILLFVILCCLCNYRATNDVFNTQPKWYFLNKRSFKNFKHVLSAGMGFRPLMADFEYIYFLQYYGDPENRKTSYKNLYSIFDSITDIDPHFTFAYTYGSAILAFNLKRYDEAIALINKGLKYNPTYWKLRFYLGAIVYKEMDDKDKYVGYLEEALKFDDHPAMIERILGNIYEQYKTPEEVTLYWLNIYKNTKDRETREHAYKKIMQHIQNNDLKNPRIILDQLK